MENEILFTVNNFEVNCHSNLQKIIIKKLQMTIKRKDKWIRVPTWKIKNENGGWKFHTWKVFDFRGLVTNGK